MPNPPHRVEHVHRALQDVRQMPPADILELTSVKCIDVAVAAGEIECDRTADDSERWADRAHDGLDECGLAAARFACQPVNLVAVDMQADAIDGADLAADAEISGLVVGAQVPDREHALRRRLGVGCKGWCGGDHSRIAPMRASRLRGSMYSFIEIASRNSPMNRMTTNNTGKKNHHQIPATIAVCWLAQ